MGNSGGFSLSKVISWLNSFLKSMPSPLSGFSIEDVKVKKDGDIFSSLFQFQGDSLKDKDGNPITDVNGNPIDLSVLLRATNAQTVFAPIFSGLNKMNQGNTSEANALLDVLLGENRESNPDEAEFDDLVDNGEPDDIEDQLGAFQDDTQEASSEPDHELQPIQATVDNNYASARSRGANGTMDGGLLGINFEKVTELPKDGVTYGGKKWSWYNIAYEYLKYGLECASYDDYGAIDNVTLEKCSNLISEYLVQTEVIINEDEVNIDVNTLIKPILIRMQDALAEYFFAAFDKYVTQKEETTDMSDEDIDTLADNLDFTRHIDMTLQKITGSKEIKLTAIRANYNPSEVLEDVEDIIYQDEFMGNLTGEPQSFEIDVDDDGYDIAECDDCAIDPCDSLGYLMTQGIMFYRNLYVLHWMAKGNDMMKLHLLTEELYEELIKEIDTLGELMVEKCGTVIDPNFTYSAVEIRPYEFQEGLDILKGYIDSYINFIDYAYINQSSDVQSIMDEWLRFWNKQVNYFVKGQING